MTANRRSRSRVGSTGPGRALGLRREAALLRRGNEAASEKTARPRFTSRAAILVLVLAVLAVSYASSLRAYLQQRSAINELKSQIADQRGNISDLEREKTRWKDPAFVSAQARARFGFVRKGDTPFVVVRDGQPLESLSTLSDPTDSDVPPRAWYDDTWDSMKYAGNPPRKADPPPAVKIKGPPEE